MLIYEHRHVGKFLTLINLHEPEFAKQSACARESGRANMADQCIEIADDKKLEAADKRIMIDTRLRLLGKWDPKRWGDKTQVTNASGDGPMESKVIVEFIDAPKNQE